MPKVRFNLKDLDNLTVRLGKLAAEATKLAKFSVYDGAKIAADEIRSSVSDLACVSDAEAIRNWKRRTPSLISYSQKQGLISSLGIAKMRVRGDVVNTRTGFDGYNNVVTKRWPKGQPNQMIAGSCEGGSSGMLPQPFVMPTYYRIKGRMQQAMKESFEKKQKEILDG